MFEAIKDSWYFSKAATFAMREFGLDLMKADQATNGMINEAAKKARQNQFTVEEAAASCVALASLAVAEMLDLSGQKPDYSKMHRIEKTMLFLAGQGFIREPILNQIDETIDRYYKVIEQKTGIPNEYPA